MHGRTRPEIVFDNYLEERAVCDPLPWYIGKYEGHIAVLTQENLPVALCDDYAQAEAVLHRAQALVADEAADAASDAHTASGPPMSHLAFSGAVSYVNVS